MAREKLQLNKNVVEEKSYFFTRVLRTLAFIIIALSSIVILIHLINLTVIKDNNVVLQINKFYQDLNISKFEPYIFMSFIIGILLLVLIRARFIIIKLLMLILFVLVFSMSLDGNISFLPTVLNTRLSEIIPSELLIKNNELLTQYIYIHFEYLSDLIIIVCLLFTGMILSNKPKRASARLVSGSVKLLLFLNLIFILLSLVSFNIPNFVITIIDFTYILSYLLALIGSIFGILGFTRKR